MHPTTLRRLGLGALLSALALAPVLADDAAPPPFVHVQLDRGVYRLGDVVRWRVHRPEGQAPVSLELRGPDGRVAAAAEATGPTPSGALALDPELPGGAWRLVATCEGRVVHEVPVGVFDVAPRRLALSLRVLSDVLFPGQPLVATFQARTLEGEPLAGLVGKARATFGDVVVDASVGPTDADGACVVRLVVPESVRVTGGHLAVAVEARGKVVDAVARPVRVSASVGRVDAFVQGGAVVEGRPHRVALLARDLDGRPVAAEGRVEDDQGKVVALFVADARGQALVDVPYVAGRRYRAAIDRPARVEATFPLPGPTGHARALRVEERGGTLVVDVHGEPGSAWVELVVGGEAVARAGLQVTRTGGAASLAVRGGPWTVGHVLLGEGQRVTHVAPVLLGEGWPLALTVAQRSPSRAGAPVVLEVAATRVGAGGVVLPVEGEVAVSVAHAALWEDLAGELAALSARRLLHGHLEGTLCDVGPLFAAGAPAAAREALLAIRAGRAVAPEGVEVAAARRLALPRVEVPAMTARPAAPAAEGGAKTTGRSTPLDAALARAPFTVAAAPRAPAELELEPVDPRQAVFVPARPERDLPQDARVAASRVDRRDALCWAPVVRLGKDGKGTVTLRAGDEVEALAVVALGSSGGASPLAATAIVSPVPPFQPVAALPGHLRVGDVAEVELGCEVTDGLAEPVTVRLDLPPGVRPLGPTGWVRTPQGPRTMKVRLEAVAPTTDATLRLVATRGPLRAVRRARLSVSHPAVERAVSCSGAGALSLAVQVPAGAIAGSVVTRARVTGSSTASALEGLESMLREPHGCFEQTTSTNDPNLAVLEALLERGDDAALLERAWALAEAGHARILGFQDASGGFSLWQGESEPQVRYTALAVWQLGRYARLAQGKGLEPMRRAIAWLDEHEAKGPEAALAALATIEAGVPWARCREALGRGAGSRQETALVADALAAWRSRCAGDPPGDLDEAVQRLRRAQAPDGRIPAAGEGRGVLGTAGDLLDVEVTAHAAIGFLGAGALDEARRACDFLARTRDAQGGWGTTQSTVQALRALAHLERALPGQGGRATPVTLVGGGGAVVSRLPFGSPRPLVLARALDVAPGRRAQVELSVGDDAPPLLVTLACAWREAGATSAPDASYALATSLPQVVPTGGQVELGVALEQLRPVQGEGQVVVRVGLPGGCTLDTVADPDWCARVSRHEVEGGALVLYFETPPAGVHLRVPLRARVAGTFASGPSQVAPYYEADRAAFAPGRTLKVITGYLDDPASLGR